MKENKLGPKKALKTDSKSDDQNIRIAKYLAYCGVASRRESEKMITEGRVRINGKLIDTPAIKVGLNDNVTVDDRPVKVQSLIRLWAFYKPRGVITTKNDPQNRETVYDILPKKYNNLITIGRLDYNSEGLLLLTNNGALSRYFELPKNQIERRYRVRIFGTPRPEQLEDLKKGIDIDGVHYQTIHAEIDRIQGSNTWLYMTLCEGKNREIRRVMEHLGFQVNRLIRVSYGPFSIENISPGDIKEVDYETMCKAVGGAQNLNQICKL